MPKGQVVPRLHRPRVAASGIWTMSHSVWKVPRVFTRELHDVDEGTISFVWKLKLKLKKKKKTRDFSNRKIFEFACVDHERLASYIVLCRFTIIRHLLSASQATDPWVIINTHELSRRFLIVRLMSLNSMPSWSLFWETLTEQGRSMNWP